MTETLANEDTGSSTETQAEKVITLTQKELDDLMAKTKTSVSKKYEKKLEEIGDIEELRKIKVEYEKRQQEESMKRGDFDKVLQEVASKKDAEIEKRDNIIREYKVNVPLLSAAAQYRAINAEQVKSLLISNVRLNAEGEVEVIDEKGSVRYTDKGTQYSVDDLVKEFLDKNSHFVSPTPATTHTKSNVKATVDTSFDISKLDMKNPRDREKYKEYRKSHGIA